jgi:hypothetical protein
LVQNYDFAFDHPKNLCHSLFAQFVRGGIHQGQNCLYCSLKFIFSEEKTVIFELGEY